MSTVDITKNFDDTANDTQNTPIHLKNQVERNYAQLTETTPESTKSVEFSKKRGRGRPKHASKALIIDCFFLLFSSFLYFVFIFFHFITQYLQINLYYYSRSPVYYLYIHIEFII